MSCPQQPANPKPYPILQTPSSNPKTKPESSKSQTDTATDVESRHLGPAVLRSRALTRALPPCLFVPHTVASWQGEGGAYAGEVLATMGVCTLQVRG